MIGGSDEGIEAWEIPGYAEDCGSPECPTWEPSTGEIYVDPQGGVWFYDGTAWVLASDGSGDNRIYESLELPGCNERETPYSDNQPVRALIACTHNQFTDSYQMQVVVEGQVSLVQGVTDDINPGNPYNRVDDLFYSNYEQRPAGVVRVLIDLGPSRSAIEYTHDVADCMQPLAGLTGDSFGIDIVWGCGYVTNLAWWQLELTLIPSGQALSDVVSVVQLDAGQNIEFQRLGESRYTRSFIDSPAGEQFYVRITLRNGLFNEYLVDTGNCGDDIAYPWGQFVANSWCEWNEAASTNEFHTEISGAAVHVLMVWDTSGQTWRRGDRSRWNHFYNHFKRTVDDVRSVLNDDGDLTFNVQDFAGIDHTFTLTPRLDANGRCTDGDSPTVVEGFRFGVNPTIGCTTDDSGQFLLVVEINPVVNGERLLLELDVSKVWDDRDPSRIYRSNGTQFVAAWNPPPEPVSVTVITIELLDGRFNEYLVRFSSCEEIDVLESSSNPLTAEEPEEPLVIETTSSSSTSIPRVSLPSQSSSTTTTTIAPPPSSSTSTTTTTTTTLPNVDPVISNLSVSCRSTPGTNGYTATFEITVTDDNGDPIEIFVRAFDSSLDRLPVTPESAVINSGETAVFTSSFEFTNLSYSILVSDGREGLAADSGNVGPDFGPDYCS